MKEIRLDDTSFIGLEAGSYYWARRKFDLETPEAGEIEVVQISTVFGSTREFWAVAVTGSDEHFDVDAFEFFHEVSYPTLAEGRRSNFIVISSALR